MLDLTAVASSVEAPEEILSVLAGMPKGYLCGPRHITNSHIISLRWRLVMWTAPNHIP